MTGMCLTQHLESGRRPRGWGPVGAGLGSPQAGAVSLSPTPADRAPPPPPGLTAATLGPRPSGLQPMKRRARVPVPRIKVNGQDQTGFQEVGEGRKHEAGDTGKELEGPRASGTRSRWGCGPCRRCGHRGRVTGGNDGEGAAPAPARRPGTVGTRNWLSAQDVLERLRSPPWVNAQWQVPGSSPTPPHTRVCTLSCIRAHARVTESADDGRGDQPTAGPRDRGVWGGPLTEAGRKRQFCRLHPNVSGLSKHAPAPGSTGSPA